MADQEMSNAQAAVRLLLLSAVFPLLLFPFAGRWDWGMGWALIGILIAATLLSRLLVFRVHPDLLNERASSLDAENAKPWDKVLAPAMGLTPLFVLVVAGLDERYQWSPPLGVGLQLTGLFLAVAGYAIATWAMYSNRFFSGVVRIQTERGHRVVDSGPYAYVRHPGYSGSLLAGLGFPLALASLWALLPLLLVFVVTVIRTRLEDETLRQELPGYVEFTERTRYRLLPGIW
jgi:protein-S-isoprenylcysteine O-methyltransferase Ste14